MTNTTTRGAVRGITYHPSTVGPLSPRMASNSDGVTLDLAALKAWQAGPVATHSAATFGGYCALLEWCAERAAEIVAATAPNAADYATVLDSTTDDAWDCDALMHRIAAAVIADDGDAFPDAWSIGPWWETRGDVIHAARFDHTAPMFSAVRVPFATTAGIAPKADGTYDRGRDRKTMHIHGNGKRTANGAPLSDDMAPFGALLPDMGATVADAWNAAAAMAHAGLIPWLIGNDDNMPADPVLPRLTAAIAPAAHKSRPKGLDPRPPVRLHGDAVTFTLAAHLAPALILSVVPCTAESRKDAPRVDGRPVCGCNVGHRITRRIGTAVRWDRSARQDFVRGTSVLVRPGRLDGWSRRHIGDAVVVLAPRATVRNRVTEVRRTMHKGRNVSTIAGGAPAVVTVDRGERVGNATVADIATRTARAAILAVLALATEDAAATFNGWTIHRTATTTRGHYRPKYVAVKDGTTVEGAPRKVATALANA